MHTTFYKQLFAFFLLLLPLHCLAEVSGIVLVVSYNDAGKTQTLNISLAENPEITLNKDILSISYGADNAITFQYANVVDMHFSDVIVTSIDKDNKVGKKLQLLYIDSQHLRVIGVSPNSKANLYSLNGALASTHVTRSDDSLTLDLSGLPTGVYLLNVDKQSFKIIKK